MVEEEEEEEGEEMVVTIIHYNYSIRFLIGMKNFRGQLVCRP